MVEARAHPSIDDLQIVELKRRKLLVKDEIARLQTLMIGIRGEASSNSKPLSLAARMDRPRSLTRCFEITAEEIGCERRDFHNRAAQRHMRLILGIIIGVSLTVGGVYIADAVAGTEAKPMGELERGRSRTSTSDRARARGLEEDCPAAPARFVDFKVYKHDGVSGGKGRDKRPALRCTMPSRQPSSISI
jgi:Protein of unknown function (DUF465)